ncbi:MAG TPA: hypothetical protein VHM92_10715 [Allosphingosinicella sp.]|nr:hypothetical protein [Allosphingosinicella sp.]
MFKNPMTAAKLIDDLGLFHELRSAIAHSTLSIARRDDGSCVAVFDRADAECAMPWRGRIALLADDGQRIMQRVSDLANQLSQQVCATD